MLLYSTLRRPLSFTQGGYYYEEFQFGLAATFHHPLRMCLCCYTTKGQLQPIREKSYYNQNKMIYICVFRCFSLLLKDIKEVDYQFLKVMCWLIHLFKSWYICALLLLKPEITDSHSNKRDSSFRELRQ